MLLKNIRDIWEERSLLFPTNALTRNPAIEQAIRTDLLDLTVTWIELLPAPGRAAPSRCGPRKCLAARRRCPSLVRAQRQARPPTRPADRSARPAGLTPRARFRQADGAGPLRSGTLYLRAARFREAAREFQIVLDERPRDFWSNFYQGSCAYRMEQFQDALRAAFRTCIALAPDSAVCYYNRARAAEALGRFDQAFGDYSRAPGRRHPDFSPAFLNRGSLAYSNGRHDDAIADFQRALRGELDSRTIGLIQYNLALAFHVRGDSARAIASAREALAHGNDAASSLSDRLRRERRIKPRDKSARSSQQSRLDREAGAEGQGDDWARGSNPAEAVDDEEDGW